MYHRCERSQGSGSHDIVFGGSLIIVTLAAGVGWLVARSFETMKAKKSD
jgi:hypothetical protein